MKTGLCVGDIMTKRPICVPNNLAVQETARIMKEKSVGSVLITDDEELLGIITQTDIIRKVVATGKNPAKLQTKDIMTEAMFTITPEKDVFEAMVMLKDNNIRHLPVLHKDVLVGFVTMKDILKVEPALFDLIVDTIDLREEERKLNVRPDLDKREPGETYLGYEE